MSIFVYRRASSTGARELAEALGGRRYRGHARPITEVVRRGDVVVCWGEQLPAIEGVRILNGGPFHNKYEDAARLRAAGVPTIEVSQTRPAAQTGADNAQPIWVEAVEAAEEFVELPYNRNNPVFAQGIREFSATITRLATALATPIPPAATWLPREFNHVGGNDLLHPPVAPNYFAKKENITREYRIHSFVNKSIRAGVKVAREGVPQHEWIRSYDAGWKINYDGFESNRAMRDLAHRAVTALGLQFGAVDLGQKPDGSFLVLEVNRAPGLEGGTTVAYADAINRWVEEGA